MITTTFILTGGGAATEKTFPINTNMVDTKITVQANPSGGATYQVMGTLKKNTSFIQVTPLTPYFPVGSGLLTNSNQLQTDVIHDPVSALIFTLPAGTSGSVEFTVLQQGLR